MRPTAGGQDVAEKENAAGAGQEDEWTDIKLQPSGELGDTLQQPIPPAKKSALRKKLGGKSRRKILPGKRGPVSRREYTPSFTPDDMLGVSPVMTFAVCDVLKQICCTLCVNFQLANAAACKGFARSLLLLILLTGGQ